jgi:hypothetical protein
LRASPSRSAGDLPRFLDEIEARLRSGRCGEDKALRSALVDLKAAFGQRAALRARCADARSPAETETGKSAVDLGRRLAAKEMGIRVQTSLNADREMMGKVADRRHMLPADGGLTSDDAFSPNTPPEARAPQRDPHREVLAVGRAPYGAGCSRAVRANPNAEPSPERSDGDPGVSIDRASERARSIAEIDNFLIEPGSGFSRRTGSTELRLASNPLFAREPGRRGRGKSESLALERGPPVWRDRTPARAENDWGSGSCDGAASFFLAPRFLAHGKTIVLGLAALSILIGAIALVASDALKEVDPPGLLRAIGKNATKNSAPSEAPTVFKPQG